MAGLVPAIHVFLLQLNQRRGCRAQGGEWRVLEEISQPNRTRERSRAFSASISRSLGAALVCSEASSRRAASDTSSTARLNAASLACDGLPKPESLRTNCSAEARISSSVAGGSKLNSVLMFRHMTCLPGGIAVTRTSAL